jgi:ferritin-like metal-binding protein YciE
MIVKNPKELFVRLLNDLRFSTEKSAEIHQKLAGFAQEPQIKEALESHAFVQTKDLASLDRCFQLIGEKPTPPDRELRDIVIEDFKRELNEIQSPAAKALFVLVKAHHLISLRIAEYKILIAMADVSGHLGVGVLLESCLADKLAFVERTHRLLRHAIEIKHEIRLAA